MGALPPNPRRSPPRGLGRNYSALRLAAVAVYFVGFRDRFWVNWTTGEGSALSGERPRGRVAAMEAKDLFTLALQLSPEWRVSECQLDPAAHRLTLQLDFQPGSRFPAPGAAHQLLCPVHDTVEKKWRHLDFFQYRTELVARVPRVKTPEGQVLQVEVPWARPGSGFTLLFEAMAMLLCGQMPVKEAGALLREEDTRL